MRSPQLHLLLTEAVAEKETPEVFRGNLILSILDAQLLVENVPSFFVAKAVVIRSNLSQCKLGRLGRHKTLLVFVNHVDNGSNDAVWKSLVEAALRENSSCSVSLMVMWASRSCEKRKTYFFWLCSARMAENFSMAGVENDDDAKERCTTRRPHML